MYKSIRKNGDNPNTYVYLICVRIITPAATRPDMLVQALP